MGFSVGEGAASAGDAAGEDETEEVNDEESIVHHTASVGDVEVFSQKILIKISETHTFLESCPFILNAEFYNLLELVYEVFQLFHDLASRQLA